MAAAQARPTATPALGSCRTHGTSAICLSRSRGSQRWRMKVPGAPPGTFISGLAAVPNPDSCVLPVVEDGRRVELHGPVLRPVRGLDDLTRVDQADLRAVLLRDLGACQQREPEVLPWVNEGTSWLARREERELGADPD